MKRENKNLSLLIVGGALAILLFVMLLNKKEGYALKSATPAKVVAVGVYPSAPAKPLPACTLDLVKKGILCVIV